MKNGLFLCLLRDALMLQHFSKLGNDMYRRSVRQPQNFITLGLALSRKCTASESSGTRPIARVRIAAPTENTLEASKMRTPLYSGYVYSDRSSVVRIRGVPL